MPKKKRQQSEWRKCLYQRNKCRNWTDEGLTLGVVRSFVGPKDEKGLSTLAEVPATICGPCLAENPKPHE